jgi:hypothetical protein
LFLFAERGPMARKLAAEFAEVSKHCTAAKPAPAGFAVIEP